MKRLLIYLRNYRKELILGPFFKLLEAVFELLVPIVMAKIIDKGVANNDNGYILRMSGLIVILGICGLGFALTCQYLAAKCAYGFGTELREALNKHINSLSYTGIDRIGAASLVNRLTNDTNTVQNGVNMFIRLAVRAPFLVIGAAAMAVMIDVRLSLVFFVVAPLISAIIFIVMRRTIPMYRKAQQKLDRAAMLTREDIDGARVIRAFSRQQEETDEFRGAVDEIADCSIAVGRLSAILNPAAFAVMNLGIVAIVWFGGVRIDSGALTQGELTAFTNYMTQILLALVVLANLIVTFTKAFAAASRVSEVFEILPEESGDLVPEERPDVPVIEFRGVSFTYEGAGDSLLRNVSFSLGRGQTLGVIGGTGSGKSTLASLIPGFYRPTEGEVLVKGLSTVEWRLNCLRRTIGYVPQKAVLFSGTVRDNLTWRKADATDAELIAALKTAQAWDFVSKLPGKLDYNVSQGGRNFSGGQRQRLCIARALVGKPDILILDDSTSALDYATDLAFRRALKTDMKDTAVVMITQRTTSLTDAAVIVVMEDGEAVGIGTHSELVGNCNVYSEIYRSQMNERGGSGNA